jgi:hypothetical protein
MRHDELSKVWPRTDPLEAMKTAEIAELLGIPETKGPSSDSASGDEWPEPMSGVAFQGLAGDFVRLVLPETEADPQALLLAFLVGFGCMVGRKPF